MQGQTEDTGALRRQAAEFGVPFLDEVIEDMLDPELVAGIPVEWARANGVLPVRWKGETCLLMKDPSGVRAQEDVSLILGCELKPVMATEAAITHGIEICYYRKRDSAEQFLRDLDGGSPGTDRKAEPRSDDLLRVAEEAPVTQLVNLILLEAVKSRASDIHFEPFENRLRVRYRVDGQLYEQAAPPKHLERTLVSRLKVMGRLDIAEKRLPQDGMASVRVGEREIDIRISTIPVAEGERVVLRLLNRESSLLPLAELGMPPAVLRTFESLLGESHGLVIVCGPTGSGKTTTLYAAIRQLDTTSRNVLTIEDPIEYQLPDIGQMQVKPKIGLTFAHGLRHILRQDPDVILVGEIRDSETARIAAQAALTGHLVLTTLHTNDAIQATTRLLEMGVERFIVAASILGVLGQRLVKRLCEYCKTEHHPDPEELRQYFFWREGAELPVFYKATGCEHCAGTGYTGRVGIHEFLKITPQIREAILHERNYEEMLGIAAQQGFQNLRYDGFKKALRGLTSLEEVIRATASLEND